MQINWKDIIISLLIIIISFHILNELRFFTGFCTYDFSNFKDEIPAKFNNCLEMHKNLKHLDLITMMVIVEILIVPTSWLFGIVYYFRNSIVKYAMKILKQ